MRADTPILTIFIHVAAARRVLAAAMAGLILLGGAAVDAVASEGAANRKVDPLLEEHRVHALSVFSYLQPSEPGSRSVPLLITLRIEGPEGLRTFCEYRPKVFEAVLNVITEDQLSTGGGQHDLRHMKDQMLEELNYALPGEPVSRLDARTARTASEFGGEIAHTDRVCKKLDTLAR
jgi:hypothetical protein